MLSYSILKGRNEFHVFVTNPQIHRSRPSMLISKSEKGDHHLKKKQKKTITPIKCNFKNVYYIFAYQPENHCNRNEALLQTILAATGQILHLKGWGK